MTKNTTATLDVSTIAAPVTVSGLPPSPVPKPNIVQVSGTTIPVLQQVAHLCRQGYVPDANLPIFFNAETGAMSISMVIGSPEQAYIDLAHEKLGDAQAAQDSNYRRDVEAAARRQIEAEKQAERDAKRAALVAAHEAALKAMQEEIDAL
jgi:hypothetical protein